MNETESIRQHGWHFSRSADRNGADHEEKQRQPARGISLRDVCYFIIGTMIGYMTLGW